jgi:hypothetical protein
MPCDVEKSQHIYSCRYDTENGCCVCVMLSGVEATYDYRFNGDDQLRCNCGAPTCRGWVNLPKEEQIRKSAEDNVLLLPREEVVFLRGVAAAAAEAAACARS